MANKDQEIKKEQSKENQRMMEELSATPDGKKIAKLYRKGEIEKSTFDEAYRVSKEPKYMKKDSVKRYLKALAQGKFSKKAKFANTFLKAILHGGEREKERAEKIVEDLSHESTGKLSNRLEKNYLKELTELREEDTKEEAIEKTGAAAAAVTETAEVRGKIVEVSEEKRDNWEITAPPKELTDKLNEGDIKQYELANKINAKDRGLVMKEKILEKILKEKPIDEKRKQQVEKEIADLRMELAQMDEEMNKIREDLIPVKEEWTNYLKKSLSQFRALRDFSKRAGLDLNKVTELTMWFLKLNKEAEYMPTLEGIEYEKTGETKKKETLLKINRIYFEGNKTDMTPEAPGELMIEYTNEKGENIESSLRNFLHFIDVYEGYEKIDKIDEFNEKFAFELGYEDIAVGDTFSKKVIVDVQEGKNIEEERKFTVTAVEERDGRWVIEVDPVVTTIKKESLPNSTHPSLYFDRTESVFELGKFGTFLRKSGYQREIADEEMQEMVNRSIAARNKQYKGFVKFAPPEIKERFKRIGGIPEEELTIPGPEEVQNIISLDEYRNEREATLEVKENEEGKMDYIITEATGTDGRWWTPRIPPAMAAAGALPAVAPKRKPKIRVLNTRNFAEAANKGDFVNAPTEEEVEEEEIAPEEIEEEVPTKKPSEGLTSDLEQWRPKYYDEALSFEEVHKVGGMDKTERSYLKGLWANTRVLSVSDLWEMGKAMWEYYHRRFERRQKERYSKVGKDLPFFSPEMQRINQQAENEQVNQFKEAMDQQGVFEIQARLKKTRTRDELKAAIMTLSEKGQMRWDDIDFWQTLNRFVDPTLAVPIPSNGDPYTQLSDTDKRTGFAFLQAAIDSLWGEGQYNEWYSRNKSTYASNAKGYYEEGKELEGVEGGHERRLGELLRQHKNGEYVDPHEYEGLITHSIDYGKSNMQTKIYYMIEGVAAVNKQGRTIMSFDRVAHINSEMLAKFPILEYICASVPRKDGESHRFTIDDYKRWVKWFDRDDPMNYKPGKYVDEFMWKYVIPSNETQTRINKDLRNGENLDHDDMFAYLPPATEQVLTDSCKATTGSKKFLTIEGYANVFPGFSQYLRSLAENDNRSKLAEAVKSYVRFEGIMTNKYERGKDVYQRMDKRTLNRGTVVSPDIPPKKFIDQNNRLIEAIIEAYDDEELRRVYDTMNTEVGDVRFKENMQQQKYVDQAFDRFGEELDRVLKTDNGEKMKELTKGADLYGMPAYVSSEEIDRRKAEAGIS